MNQPVPDEWHRLFNAALNDTLTAEEKARLAQVLKEHPEARQLWFLYQDNECSLSELRPVIQPTAQPVRPSRSAWLQWRPAVAAAAGLVIGLFSASLVWGYAGTYASRAVNLLRDSFETGAAPQVSGVPLEPGHWSGDYAEIVGEYRGIKPASGDKMLRLVRADYEGKPGRDGYIADLYRIVDLNRPDCDVDRGDAWVSVEARFRALAEDYQGRVHSSITIHALNTLPTAEQRYEFFLKPRSVVVSSEGDGTQPSANILASTSRQSVYQSTTESWHTGRAELLVPPGTRYLMLHLHEWRLDAKDFKKPQPIEFSGLFLDDVRVTLTHRPPLP
ncbi:hypothetical protein [Verrucomicrobium sp. BvORR106]|uniref:hypothetical protein n=1 Tax=Verrucomicrobium sp. BvORR106 TaxID=1403819 RepID=UPI0005703DC2|nr:hypothetical protein [Verrucomicrobium sp. BvORR106]